MSGWAKANAVPDNKQTATGDDAAAKDKYKQFGLRAIITYSDNTTEYHYVPFNPDITGWQYVSTAIVPKKENYRGQNDPGDLRPMSAMETPHTLTSVPHRGSRPDHEV